MAHQLKWLVDKRVLLIKYTGAIDKDTLLSMNADMNRILEEGIQPVHVIADNTEMSDVRVNLKVIQQSFGTLRNPAWGQITIVTGENKMVAFFSQLIGTSFRIKLRVVNTMEDAKRIINQADNTVNLT
ncbi:MAG: hypothetical protein AAF846_16670 [Chloroflexota bacterium]